MQGHPLPFRNSGTTWELRESGGGIRFELLAGETRIGLWGIETVENPAPLYLGLHLAITEALRASGMLPLHAAVAMSGVTALACLGGSGSGKSTTLLYAARKGWRAICEDLCWLETGSLQVYGWDRVVRTRPDALERFFPDLADAPAAPDGKRLIPYGRLGPEAPRSCVLSHLALLAFDVGGGPSRWERATEREVVKALWEAGGVPLHEPSRQLAATAIARLSRSMPAARLVLGNNLPPLDEAARGWTGQG